MNETIELSVSPDRVRQFVEEKQRGRFFGKVTLVFQAGKITHMDLEQRLKPQDVG